CFVGALARALNVERLRLAPGLRAPPRSWTLLIALAGFLAGFLRHVPRTPGIVRVDSLWVLLPAGQRASGEWIDDTLRARAEEKGLLARTPLAGEFPPRRGEVIRAADPTAEVNRLYRLRGWTDGLPIVPPTLGRLDEMIDEGALDRHAVPGEMEPLRGVASVEKVAANAVMAGCQPEYFPVVLAAVQAILD